MVFSLEIGTNVVYWSVFPRLSLFDDLRSVSIFKFNFIQRGYLFILKKADNISVHFEINYISLSKIDFVKMDVNLFIVSNNEG